MKKLIKSLIPPILLSVLIPVHRRFKGYGWYGDYKSWEEVKRHSEGYEKPEILERVRSSALKVKRREAAYERDGVIFDEIQYSWPLLAGLMYASAKAGGELRVLDFGGSLGSTYFQSKKFLDGLKLVSWSIVEQKHFVDVGKAEFEDDKLKFYYDIESCIKNENPNVLLLSGVLQYIEKPYEILEELLGYNIEVVIADRTPVIKKDRDILKVQIVPRWIYKASYPCWFFNLDKLMEAFQKSYRVLEIFDAIDGKLNDCEFKGFILERKYA